MGPRWHLPVRPVIRPPTSDGMALAHSGRSDEISPWVLRDPFARSILPTTKLPPPPHHWLGVCPSPSAPTFYFHTSCNPSVRLDYGCSCKFRSLWTTIALYFTSWGHINGIVRGALSKSLTGTWGLDHSSSEAGLDAGGVDGKRSACICRYATRGTHLFDLTSFGRGEDAGALSDRMRDRAEPVGGEHRTK